MPAYTYRCKVCGEVFTRRYSFNEKPDVVVCPNGHTDVVRVFQPPVVVFKGSGFYVTDHGNGGGRNGNGTKPKNEGAKANTSEPKAKAAKAPAGAP